MIKWFVIFLMVSQPAFCQQLIEGKIVDSATGEPVPFASVSIVGTAKGTSSNIDGQFSLYLSGPATLKVTSVGYESAEVNLLAQPLIVRLKATVTQLDQIVVLHKKVDAGKIVKRAFARIAQNYSAVPFEQQFFYRHYCKDDSVYGRLIEAFIDVWKRKGYSSPQKAAGEKEEIRVTQLRRSIDKTVMAQGHAPMALGNILQADIVGYQTAQKSEHASFFADVSNLKADFSSYTFEYERITSYDGQEVYEISYTYKSDSALTTSGAYLQLNGIAGTLFIATDTYAIVMAQDVKRFGPNVTRTAAYYRKYNNLYYPYHFIRNGKSYSSDGSMHMVHIDLVSVEINNAAEIFYGREPGNEQLLNIPYDSAFWINNSQLKTTPLEEKIIRDLGGGNSLKQQFEEYRQHEINVHNGGEKGEEKLNWLISNSKGKSMLYLLVWTGDGGQSLTELEMAKWLNIKYQNQVTFVFLSVNEDDHQWQEIVSKHNLTANGIINYRVRKDVSIIKQVTIPAYILIARDGTINSNAKHPGDPSLEEVFKLGQVHDNP